MISISVLKILDLQNNTDRDYQGNIGYIVFFLSILGVGMFYGQTLLDLGMYKLYVVHPPLTNQQMQCHPTHSPPYSNVRQLVTHSPIR
jgi:hypothetical protein